MKPKKSRMYIYQDINFPFVRFFNINCGAWGIMRVLLSREGAILSAYSGYFRFYSSFFFSRRRFQYSSRLIISLSNPRSTGS